jgi:nicotinamide mononucleotide adenylyltransferase
MSKQKLNLAIGRYQPFTQGHLNMVNEGEAPCIVYRINSSNKTIERKKKGIKIASKSWTDESVNKVIEYIDNQTSDLTENKIAYSNYWLDYLLLQQKCDEWEASHK